MGGHGGVRSNGSPRCGVGFADAQAGAPYGSVRCLERHGRRRRGRTGRTVMAMPGLWSMLKRTGEQWLAHKSPKAGASLAYYSIFSIGPLIVVVISVASLVFQRQGVQDEVTSAIRGLVGSKGAEAVATMLAGAGRPSEGLIAALIGVSTLLFAAVGVVVQLKEALNVVWDARPPTRSGLWAFVREYILSFAAVLALGFLMLVSMLVTAGLAAVGKHMGGLLPESLMQAVGFTVSFLTIALLFAI